MYEAYFHFQSSPFPAMPVVGNYFPTQAIEAARQALVRVIERAEGPGFVVGPAGVGKTLLLRVLADHFGEVFRVALLSGTRIDTRKALLQNILFELGVPYRGMDEGELRLALIDCLRPSDSCPNGILLLVDEAHTLSLKLLDEIRMITNVVRDGQPRARLVLAGGTALEERFASPKLESLNQRIAARCYLQSFTRDETYEYVRAQVSWSGADPDALFPDDAVRAVYQATDGVPRLINQVCDHGLVMARDRGVRRLDPSLIQEAWADLQQLPPPWQQPESLTAKSNSTVIEFGTLDETDEDESLVEVTSAFELDSVFESAETDRTAATAALQAVPMTGASDDAEAESLHAESESLADADESTELSAEEVASVQSMSFCALTDIAQQPTAWIEAVEYVEELPEEVLANDPFEDDFEEEVVVIDRHAAWELEAFRGRPKVTCGEGRQVAAHLEHVGNVESPAVEEPRSTVMGSPVEPEPAFEFSTLEPRALEVEWSNQPAQDVSFLQPEADLDEEIESVPLPWMSPTADDRDVIIVEEDLADISLLAAGECDAEKARRVEYRQLFAQLRRATP